jgi:N-acetylneuraminic acid mutarotase
MGLRKLNQNQFAISVIITFVLLIGVTVIVGYSAYVYTRSYVGEPVAPIASVITMELNEDILEIKHMGGEKINDSFVLHEGESEFEWYDSFENEKKISRKNNVKIDNGEVCLDSVRSDVDGFVYVLRGKLKRDFWRYNISDDSWKSLADTLDDVGAGGSLAYDGGDKVYLMIGNNEKTFCQYSISTDIWTYKADIPESVGNGGSLVYDRVDYIYALLGGNKFYRYSISSNNWVKMNNLQYGTVDAGGSLALAEDGNIYAFQGGQKSSFWSYNILNDEWSILKPFPGKIGAGANLVYYDEYIYATEGNQKKDFYKYSIENDSWYSLSDTPERVGLGGALVSTGDGFMYSLRGQGNERSFWRYTVVIDEWYTDLKETPAEMGIGGDLFFVKRYKSSASLVSDPIEPSRFTRWNRFYADHYLPSGTHATYSILRASTNEPLLEGLTGNGDDISSIGNENSIKLRASFSTSNSTNSPILYRWNVSYDARVSYIGTKDWKSMIVKINGVSIGKDNPDEGKLLYVELTDDELIDNKIYDFSFGDVLLIKLDNIPEAETIFSIVYRPAAQLLQEYTVFP